MIISSSEVKATFTLFTVRSKSSYQLPVIENEVLVI